jgi:hypothetical protein
MSSQAAIEAGQRLASADVDALERGFEEEHLELLPAEVADFRRMAVGGDDDDVE